MIRLKRLPDLQVKKIEWEKDLKLGDIINLSESETILVNGKQITGKEDLKLEEGDEVVYFTSVPGGG